MVHLWTPPHIFFPEMVMETAQKEHTRVWECAPLLSNKFQWVAVAKPERATGA